MIHPVAEITRKTEDMVDPGTPDTAGLPTEATPQPAWGPQDRVCPQPSLLISCHQEEAAAEAVALGTLTSKSVVTITCES